MKVRMKTKNNKEMYVNMEWITIYIGIGLNGRNENGNGNILEIGKT